LTEAGMKAGTKAQATGEGTRDDSRAEKDIGNK